MVEEKIRAADQVIEQLGRQVAQLDNAIAAELWAADYETEDYHILGEEVFQPLVACLEGIIRLRAHRALAQRNGAVPGGRVDFLPFVNGSACGTLSSNTKYSSESTRRPESDQ